ncbi:MAG: amidohydrolase family protein [Chloroflexi bacterium]|nr:amidohydrolase family protein [Chloroflexota bacterium]
MFPPPRRLYLRCDALITCAGPDAAPIERAAVLIQDDRIAAAGRAADVPIPSGAEVAEYPGCALLPGLIDGHVHLMYRRGETVHDHAARFDDQQLLVRSAFHARLLVEAGVTTVRDCGSRGTFLQALRDGIVGGLLPGPRLLVSGPPVTTTAGHLWPCGGEVDSAGAARTLVRRLVKEGVDFVKVMATGGRMTPGSNVGRAQFSVDELRAIVDDAHRLGRRVAAHCLGTVGIAAATDAGVDTIEHCAWLDETGERYAFDESVARRMADRGTYCNLATQPNRVLAEKPRNQPLTPVERRQLESIQQRWHWFRRGIELGVPSFFSTDAIYGQWEDSCRDLLWLTTLIVERAGIAPSDALRMVTAIPAQALGIDEHTGTIAPGKIADLLLVRGDPLHTIRDLHNTVAVYQSGRLTHGQPPA